MCNEAIKKTVLKFSEIQKGESFIEFSLDDYKSEKSIFLKPFEIKIKIKKQGTDYEFNCSFSTELELVCDRCLGNYSYSINDERTFFIGNTESNYLDRFDIREFGGEIDIADFIEDEIIMDLPPQKICKKECSGLEYNSGPDFK